MMTKISYGGYRFPGCVDAEGDVLDVLVQSRLAWPFYFPFFSMTCLRFVNLGASGL
jgi:hypothetical protein